jgi:hypothetical protein
MMEEESGDTQLQLVFIFLEIIFLDIGGPSPGRDPASEWL